MTCLQLFIFYSMDVLLSMRDTGNLLFVILLVLIMHFDDDDYDADVDFDFAPL